MCVSVNRQMKYKKSLREYGDYCKVSASTAQCFGVVKRLTSDSGIDPDINQ